MMSVPMKRKCYESSSDNDKKEEMKAKIDTMGPVDLILFSLESSEPRNFVTSQRILTTNMNVKIGRTVSEISLVFGNGSVFNWKFWPDMTMLEDVPKEFIDVEEAGPMRKMDFFKVKIDETTELEHCILGPEAHTIHTIFAPVATTIRKLTNHLLTLFPNTKLGNASLDLDMLPYSDQSIRILPFCHCKQLHVKWGHRDVLDTWNDVFTWMRAESGLCLEMADASSFDLNDVPVNYEVLVLNHCQWLKQDTFLKFTCRRMVLNPRGALSYENFNEYLKKWFEGAVDLEMLEVRDCEMDWMRKMDLEMGMKRRPRNLRNRGKFFRHDDKLFDFSTAHDYIRDDGVEASLICRREGFIFVTWKNPQHSIEPLHGMYHSTLHVDDNGWLYPVYHKACTYRDDVVRIEYQRIMDNIIS